MIVQCYSNSATKANMYAYYSYAVVFVMFLSQQIIWQIIFCNCLYLYSASIQLIVIIVSPLFHQVLVRRCNGHRLMHQLINCTN